MCKKDQDWRSTLEQSLASLDGVLEKLDTKIKETNREAERITDIQTIKENQHVEGDLNKAKDAIKVTRIKKKKKVGQSIIWHKGTL